MHSNNYIFKLSSLVMAITFLFAITLPVATSAQAGAEEGENDDINVSATADMDGGAITDTTLDAQDAMLAKKDTEVSRVFKANFTSEATCAQSFASTDAKTAKRYGKVRLQKRINSIKRLNIATNKFYKEREDTHKKVINSIKITNDRYAKGKKISDKLPADHKKDIKKNITSRKAIFVGKDGKSGYLEKFNKAKTPTEIGEAVCPAVIKARVYNGLQPMAYQQMSLDRSTMRNAINQARYDASKNMFERKTKEVPAGMSKNLPNPAGNNTELKALQATLDSGKSVLKYKTCKEPGAQGESLCALSDKVIKAEAPAIIADYKAAIKYAKEHKKSDTKDSDSNKKNDKNSGGKKKKPSTVSVVKDKDDEKAKVCNKKTNKCKTVDYSDMSESEYKKAVAKAKKEVNKKSSKKNKGGGAIYTDPGVLK